MMTPEQIAAQNRINRGALPDEIDHARRVLTRLANMKES